MEKLLLKMVSIALAVVFAVSMVPSFAMAANENTESELEAIILDQGDKGKIIYIKGLEEVEFKYTFSDDENETTGFVTATLDSTNNQNVVDLQSSQENKKYLLIETKESDSATIKIRAIELNSIKVISENEVNDIEALTSKIPVTTDKTYSYSKTEGNTTVTTTVGKIVIDDEGKESAVYKYQLIEIYDLNKTAEKIDEKAEDLYSKLTSLKDATTMFEKLNIEMAIKDNYTSLLQNAKWQDMEEYSVLQPEEAIDGEKYILLIQKSINGDVVEQDVQFMTCNRLDAEGVEETTTTVMTAVEKKSKLPVTGEQIALYIALGIIILAILIIAIRMIMLKGKSNGKH